MLSWELYLKQRSTRIMNIQTLIGIDGYSLFVSRGSKNLYSLSIIDRQSTVHSFAGVYPSLATAIARGKAVIENLQYWQSVNH